MENKKNIIVIILVVIIAILSGVIGWIIGSKNNDVEKDLVNDSKIEEVQENKENTEVNIEEAFKNFVVSKNLQTSSDGYDWDALHSENCTNAISATGDGYSLELFVFEYNDSSIKKYNEQNNYQLEVHNVEKLIGTSNTDKYDYYEAILVPNLEKAPAATGNEYNYIYQLRIDNFYISLFETSTISDKTKMINIVKELKNALEVQ